MNSEEMRLPERKKTFFGRGFVTIQMQGRIGWRHDNRAGAYIDLYGSSSEGYTLELRRETVDSSPIDTFSTDDFDAIGPKIDKWLSSEEETTAEGEPSSEE